MSKSGTIKTFNSARGFGYITADDGSEDVFFHLQAVSNGNESSMIPGTKLLFEVGLNNTNGMTKAVQVSLMGAGDPATPQEVHQFLLMNPVEEKAQQKFMQMDPTMQRMVLNRGSLEGSRDPTAAFIGRMVSIERGTKVAPVAAQDLQGMKAGTIKTFNNGKGFGYITPADGSEDVFFHLQAVQNGNEINMLPGARLKYEMGMDGNSGKMKAVKVSLEAPGTEGMTPATPQEVEQFLMLNPVEGSAQTALRAAPPMAQRMVINRGSLEGARDPSATLVSRIMKVNTGNLGQGYGKAGGGGAPGLPGASPYGNPMKGAPFGKGSGKGPAPENETVFVKSLPIESTYDSVSAIFAQYGQVKAVKVLPAARGLSVVAAFVTMSSVAEAKMLVETMNGQILAGLANPVEIVFATPKDDTWGKGFGKGMFNPMMGNPMMGDPRFNPAVMGNPMMGNPMMGNPMMGNPMMVNPMANANVELENPQTGTLQNFGKKGFGYITPDVGGPDLVFFHVQAVLNATEYDMIPGVRVKYEMGIDVPSGRTKAVKVVVEKTEPPAPGNGVPATQVEVEQFLLENPVEQHAQDKLRALDPFVQKWVINRGALGFAREPTGALISRIVSLEKIASGQLQLPPGDWICQNCGDHQFARNVTCRSCGAPKPM